MLKLIRSNKLHDFYHDKESGIFNILPRGKPCGMGGYKSCLAIMAAKGYCRPWEMEGAARVRFFAGATNTE